MSSPNRIPRKSPIRQHRKTNTDTDTDTTDTDTPPPTIHPHIAKNVLPFLGVDEAHRFLEATNLVKPKAKTLGQALLNKDPELNVAELKKRSARKIFNKVKQRAEMNKDLKRDLPDEEWVSRGHPVNYWIADALRRGHTKERLALDKKYVDEVRETMIIEHYLNSMGSGIKKRDFENLHWLTRWGRDSMSRVNIGLNVINRQLDANELKYGSLVGIEYITRDIKTEGGNIPKERLKTTYRRLRTERANHYDNPDYRKIIEYAMDILKDLTMFGRE